MTIVHVSKTSLANFRTIGVKSTFMEKNNIRTDLNSMNTPEEVRKLKKTVSQLKIIVQNIPDIRHDKIEEVKAKLAQSFYDKPEVIDLIAKSIIDSFHYKNRNITCSDNK